MSGWWDVRAAAPDLVVRPLTSPIPVAGERSRFEASLSATLRLLATELRMIDARRVILELDVPDRAIRNDGLPRADARPDTPALAISFDSPHGPLRYATGEYRRWEDNLRAITLSLQALRAVDRYGVSKRGEQYRGWRELPTGTDPADAIVTEEQAWRTLTDAAGVPVDSSPILNGISKGEVIRRALRATHPDTGGDATEFRKVMKAKEVLAA